MGKTLNNKKVSILLFLLVWLTYVLVAMTRNAASAAIAAIVDEGAMTKSQAGLITSVFYLVYGILQIPGGILADRYKPDRLILIGVIGSGIANAITIINSSYPVIMGAWVLNALSQFALWPSIIRILSSELEKSHRKMGIFYISIVTPAGTFLSYVVAIAVSRWQDNFTFAAVVMFVFAVVFAAGYKKISKYMVPDTEETVKIEEKKHSLTKWQIILGSGLLLLLPVNLVREIVSSGLRQFAPVMFMETYETISPAIGNSFNLIIILAGVAGVFLVRGVLYPKIIKGELTGWLISFAVCVPFAVLTLLIGKINVAMIVVFFSIIYAFISAAFLFVNAWVQKFHKYGCEGTVAGIVNAFACIGIVLESYGLGKLAEITGNWYSTIWLWIILLAVSCVLISLAAVMWKRFNKANETKGENGNA
ncbi:MAG: MFS transporter [Clostridia bacterium]|nr:MFS transporter [Clostridia bacterium]